MAKSKTGSRNEKKRQKSREIKKKGKSGSVTNHPKKFRRGDMYDEKYIMYYQTIYHSPIGKYFS